MADDIDRKIERRLQPLNVGFKAIIQQNVENLQRDIARMEFRRDSTDSWTVEDAADLAQKRIDLANQREALTSIRAAERTQ
jgi:hypothetical protein